ncbi:hypothetical protein B0T25DRAFT_132297 [Lasiosphaeria hispida]|uniref:Uncharacterized protein n=1 Tax=Lasiosphaeria hispida TaxID=260671 RepID=A0AAJ0HSX0_9PEZI|nr:hypothetical protein B0T25DRAFT_132297 [Lasiosphaeria hispida]
MVHITKYISLDSAIGSKVCEKQFDELIFKPLSLFDKTMLLSIGLIVIIDTLGKCEDLKEVQDLLGMLEDLESLCQVQLRVFVTSRADELIVSSFE